jgi:hypothetical protein
MADHSTDGLVSRRDVLKRVGVAGAAAAVPIDAIAQATREPFETLTAAEGATLEAIVARLIPTDANGPGAAKLAPRATSIARSADSSTPFSSPIEPGLAASSPTLVRRKARRSLSSPRRIRMPC